MKKSKCDLFILLLKAIVLLCCVNSCSSPGHYGNAPGSRITREKATELAQMEISRLGWTQFTVDDVEFLAGHWEVVIWRTPATPGGFITVFISKEGKVIKTQRGQ
jgi:hypothetical protein